MTTNETTTTQVTDAQIAQLRTQAAEAGDHAQVIICDIATGAVVLDEDTTIESLGIAAHIASEEARRDIAKYYGDAQRARAECAWVIAAAE